MFCQEKLFIDEFLIDLLKVIKNLIEVCGMKSVNVSKYCFFVSFFFVKVNIYFLGKLNVNFLEQVQSYVYYFILLGCIVIMEIFYVKKIIIVICL